MQVRGTHEVEAEAKRFVAGLHPRAQATVVALSGDLGAGKTAFVKAVAKVMGVEEHVTSPTFVIMKVYNLERQKFEKLIHIDAYRLKGMRHLKVLGWEELVHDPHNLIFVEWPEQVAEAIPKDAVHVGLRYSGEDIREIIYVP